MALDGILLCKIIPGICEHLPARIQKIYQIASSEVLFQIHGRYGKAQLMISCHSQYNRMLITEKNYPTPDEPSNFVMVLRKYLEGATITGIEQKNLDRWCVMNIRRRNDLGDAETIYLYVELMGKYANVILVSRDNIIIDALKRIPPFENSRRILHPGARFKETPAQDKRNPFEDPHIEEGKSLTQQFSGFSPFLSKEAEYRMSRGQSFSDFMKEIQDSTSIFIAGGSDNPPFHCIDLKSVGPCTEYPLFEGFDVLYYHKEEKDRIKQISGDIYHVVKRELKHQKLKYPRLLKEYDEAMDCDRWNKYGELLYVYGVGDTKGKTSIELEDYETGSLVAVPLDPRLDGRRNAQKCYQKYSKLKKGQKYLQEQIEICSTEISYFEGLIEQLDLADFDTAEQIRQELVKGGYMDEKRGRRNRRKKKNEEVQPHTVIFNGVQISYGKNNLQNEALTWHRCRKSDIWLHAKDYHGSHVVIHTENPGEETLRFAACLAAYFSKGRNSSSVPVNYCRVSALKKIPGGKPGMVQLGSYKTIYIDPDAAALSAHGVVTG